MSVSEFADQGEEQEPAESSQIGHERVWLQGTDVEDQRRKHRERGEHGGPEADVVQTHRWRPDPTQNQERSVHLNETRHQHDRRRGLLRHAGLV